MQILMAEDSLSDAELARQAFKGGVITTHLSIVQYGEEAMRYLRAEGVFAGRVMPDLVIIDFEYAENGRQIGFT